MNEAERMRSLTSEWERLSCVPLPQHEDSAGLSSADSEVAGLLLSAISSPGVIRREALNEFESKRVLLKEFDDAVAKAYLQRWFGLASKIKDSRL